MEGSSDSVVAAGRGSSRPREEAYDARLAQIRSRHENPPRARDARAGESSGRRALQENFRKARHDRTLREGDEEAAVKQRVCVVEDDVKLGAQIVEILREAGFEATWIR